MYLRSTYICSVICIVLSFCHVGYSRLAPDFILPCNDTSSQCLTKATQHALPEFVKGMPELGVPSLDPFIIDQVSIPLAGIKTTFYKGKVTGFRTCIVDQIKYNLERRNFKIDFHCNLTIKGTYSAKGNLLTFPIDGAGDAKIKLTNLRVKMDLHTKHTRDAEKRLHINIKSYKYDFDYGDRVTFDLKNLFKESKELSDAVLLFINQNWKPLAQEFGKPVVDYAVELAVRTVEKFFHAVPCDEILYVPIPEDE